MPVFSIKYQITNDYQDPVERVSLQLLVIPAISEQLLSLKMSSSFGHSGHISTNCFGFKTVCYYKPRPIIFFDFQLEAQVKIDKINPFDFQYPEPNLVIQELDNFRFQLNQHLFLSATPLTFLEEHYKELPCRKNYEHLIDYLTELNNFIYDKIEYINGESTISTTALDTWAHKKGVCQDYAHLFIAQCRANGIPARYVSGYLDQGAEMTGSAQLHAWVEVNIPYVGWKGFDPTNNLLVDHHYIKIAHGLDFNDCTPIKGVFSNVSEQTSKHHVEVINQ